MRKIFILVVLLGHAIATHAQSVVVTDSSSYIGNANALLDIYGTQGATNKGLLLPRINASSLASLSLTSAEAGMIFYQRKNPTYPIYGGLFYWTGAGWITLSGNLGEIAADANWNYTLAFGHKAGFNLTTSPRNILIGSFAGYTLSTSASTDNIFVGYKSGYLANGGAIGNIAIGSNSGAAITTASNNTFIGLNCGSLITTGGDNSIIGKDAGKNLAGAATANVMMGHQAGENFVSGTNTFIGQKAGNGTVGATGTLNVAIGQNAGLLLSSGGSNVLIGRDAGAALTNKSENTFIGKSAGSTQNVEYCTFIGSNSGINTGGTYQTAVGAYSLMKNTGNANTAIGVMAGQNSTTGNYNTFLGRSAGEGTGVGFNGSSNTAIGYFSLQKATDGCNYNSALGDRTLANATTASLNIAIGYNSGLKVTSGSYNTFIGVESASSTAGSVSGNYNISLGYRSLYKISGTYHRNIGIGASSLFSLTGADNNLAIGYASGYSITTGSSNTIIGGTDAGALHAGYNLNTTSSRNVIIGSGAGPTTLSVYNDKFYLDNSQNDNPLLWGDFATDSLIINSKAKVASLTATDKIVITGNNALWLTGDATVWKDLLVPSLGMKTDATAPTLTAGYGGNAALMNYYFAGSVTDDQVYFTVQMPHDWKEGSTIEPHVHFAPTTPPGATTCTWELVYSWQNINEVSPGATTLTTTADLTGTSQWQNIVKNFSAIDGTGKTISSILTCRLKRIGTTDTYNSPVALLYFDIHYESDGLGARGPSTK